MNNSGYIYPILNDKNLEEALNSIGYTYAKKIVRKVNTVKSFQLKEENKIKIL